MAKKKGLKVKLLKKVRKRFSWRYNSDGEFLLNDNKKKRTRVYTKKYMSTISKMPIDKITDKNIPCGVEEWIWRELKDDMLSPYGYTFEEMFFKESDRQTRKSKDKNKPKKDG